MKAHRLVLEDLQIAIENACQHLLGAITITQHGCRMWQITNHRFDFRRNRIRDTWHELHDVTTGSFHIARGLHEDTNADSRWSLFTGGEVVCEILTNFA